MLLLQSPFAWMVLSKTSAEIVGPTRFSKVIDTFLYFLVIFIENFGTHVITSVTTGGKDVIYVRQHFVITTFNCGYQELCSRYWQPKVLQHRRPYKFKPTQSRDIPTTSYCTLPIWKWQRGIYSSFLDHDDFSILEVNFMNIFADLSEISKGPEVFCTIRRSLWDHAPPKKKLINSAENRLDDCYGSSSGEVYKLAKFVDLSDISKGPEDPPAHWLVTKGRFPPNTYCLIAESCLKLKLWALVGLTELPAVGRDTVSCQSPAVASGDSERERLTVEIQVALPILPPVSGHGLPPGTRPLNPHAVYVTGPTYIRYKDQNEIRVEMLTWRVAPTTIIGGKCVVRWAEVGGGDGDASLAAPFEVARASHLVASTAAQALVEEGGCVVREEVADLYIYKWLSCNLGQAFLIFGPNSCMFPGPPFRVYKASDD
ncbi:MAC/Perforin domain-containing protein [Striga asiatica]|uniref:MAC/Perforin domain-containing protein n=1 Tax=Striga asiatica TaxID=4170 RepID=A0A5A7RDA7_STRAF|nr:MAC/Perforin domain-containing protein [Striga asiatica]